MKNKVLTRVALTSAVLTLMIAGAACGSKKDPQTSSLQDNMPVKSELATNSNQSGENRRGNFTPSDVIGEISVIEGNVITLKTFKQPEFTPGMGPGKGRRNMENGTTPGGLGADAGTSSENRPRRGRLGPGADGERPQGERPDAERPQGNRPDGEGPEGRGNFQRQMTYTGQTEKITLSDTVGITSNVRGQNGMEQKTVALKDLKVGDTLQIWYSDKEKKTISRISVRTPNPNR